MDTLILHEKFDYQKLIETTKKKPKKPIPNKKGELQQQKKTKTKK